MKNDNIDKYTKKILQQSKLPEVSKDFTSEIMNKIAKEKASTIKSTSFKTRHFIILFSIVFIPIIIIALFSNGGSYSFPEYLSFFENIKKPSFDFSLSANIFTENIFMTTLPASIGLLIIIDHFFLRSKKMTI